MTATQPARYTRPMDSWATRALAWAGPLVATACGQVNARPDAALPHDAASQDTASRDAPLDAPAMPYCAADTALVGCYEFEPALPSTKLVDSASAHNDGTISGATHVVGHDGAALRFNLDTTRVIIPESPSLDVTSVTVELWVRTDADVAPGERATLLNNNLEYGAVLISGNLLQCQFVLPPPPGELDPIFFFFDTAVAIDDGLWTHIACTYDRTTGVGRGFINGTQRATDTAVTPGSLNTTAIDGSVIGADSPCGSVPCASAFEGEIDSLRIWNRARTPAEICADSGRTGC
jgi:hypothetical protein